MYLRRCVYDCGCLEREKDEGSKYTTEASKQTYAKD